METLCMSAAVHIVPAAAVESQTKHCGAHVRCKIINKSNSYCYSFYPSTSAGCYKHVMVEMQSGP
jgi:hypothetical protein